MPGAFTHTTRTTGQVLTASIYNTDFTDIIDHLEPAYIDDLSTNLAAMQATTDPGELASESLPTTLAGELQRQRYALYETKTAIDPHITQWYQTPYAYKVVNVLSYGAVGDGSTNDTSAISSAVSAASAGDVLYFPPNKTYKIGSGGVNLTKRLKVVGDGATISLTSSHGFNLLAPAEIQGFTFTSTLTSTVADVAIYSRNAIASGYDISETRIHDCTFGRVSLSIWCNDTPSSVAASGIWVFRNRFNGDYTNAITGHGYDLLSLYGWNDIYVCDNRYAVINSETMVKIASSSRRIHIIGNTFRSLSGANGKQCMDLYTDSREIVISGNTFDLNGNETNAVELKNGDNSADYSEPSEIMCTGNVVKNTTANAAAYGGFAFFGAWGLAEGTLTRNTCHVNNNIILINFTVSNDAAPITVRGFTHAHVNDNIVWRDLSTYIPVGTYGIECSNNRVAHITNNQIEYGVILVSGVAAHPQGTTYGNDPETVVIKGNTIRSYKSYGAVFIYQADITDVVISGNILQDASAGSGSNGFLYYYGAGTINKLVMNGNSGSTDGSIDLSLANGATITTPVVCGNSWQRGKATWDPGTINNGTSGSTTVTVFGAAVGDMVTVGLPYSSQGAIVTARVSASNTVTIGLYNYTGGNLTFASGVWTAQTSRA